MMPMPDRLTTSVLLRREGRMMMFDAGEGTQIGLKKSGAGIRSLDVIAVTHLHADHVLGIPGLLMFRAQADDPGPLTIVGPPGIQRFVTHTIEDLSYYVGYELSFREWNPHGDPVALEWNDGRLLWEPLEHTVFCLGYRYEENPRPGRFYPHKATALGVPPGPLFGELHEGRSVTTGEGGRVAPEDVMGPPRRGRIVAFATDTRPCPGLGRVLGHADLAFVEGMFSEDHAVQAEGKGHLTAGEAAQVALDAGVRRLVLVHLSPRYQTGDEDKIAAEASRVHPAAEVGRELGVYPIPLPG
jgi:ribonuclease Z